MTSLAAAPEPAVAIAVDIVRVEWGMREIRRREPRKFCVEQDEWGARPIWGPASEPFADPPGTMRASILHPVDRSAGSACRFTSTVSIRAEKEV